MPSSRCLPTLALALALAACEEKPKGSAAPAPPAAAPSAAQPAGSAAASAAASAAGSAAAPAAGVAESTLAGTWEGDYEAKKGEVELPPKVKDKTYEKDDGKAQAGKGSVKLMVAADGEVTGTSEGALGEAVLSGHAENKILRASFSPKDPRAPSAMTGVLVATVKDGALVGHIRAAGPDGSVVREAPIALRKK